MSQPATRSTRRAERPARPAAPPLPTFEALDRTHAQVLEVLDQFDQLLQTHRAPWNRFPNPMFELDHLTTACVAVAMTLPDGEAAVLRQARTNLLARSRTNGPTAN